MRTLTVGFFLLCVPFLSGADELPKVSGSLGGKPVTFPAKGIPDGVKAAIGLLESCTDESVYQADERTKAEQGDHVRLTFAKPVAVKVQQKSFEITELVFRRPSETGVFWVRTGDTWRRFTKFRIEKEKPFDEWLRQATTGR
jgi:hypothetical protein